MRGCPDSFWEGEARVNLEQKWAAHQLLRNHETGPYRVIAAVLTECKAEEFEKLRQTYPDEIEGALREGIARRQHLEKVLARAAKTLMNHPALFTELGELAEFLLQRVEAEKKPT